QEEGDVLARLNVRFDEFEASAGMINKMAEVLDKADKSGLKAGYIPKAGAAIGSIEAWRGPVIIWVRTDPSGRIERCKITDPSFKNWQGLCFSVLGNIIPDFPLCNKSFDLSYPGNDL
ncbi:MAG: hydrogenase expression protein HypE, partial [Candidatus Omnitrophota bacterium]